MVEYVNIFQRRVTLAVRFGSRWCRFKPRDPQEADADSTEYRPGNVATSRRARLPISYKYITTSRSPVYASRDYQYQDCHALERDSRVRNIDIVNEMRTYMQRTNTQCYIAAFTDPEKEETGEGGKDDDGEYQVGKR